ncbi:uncharacterized protein LOC114671702 isoform X1 [Macaca mulatta]
MEMEEGRGGGRGLGLSEEGDKMEAGLDVAGDWLWVWTQGTHWLWSRPGSRAGSGKHRMTWYCVRTWWVLGLTDFKNEAADPHASRSSESTGSLLEMPIVSLCPRSTELDFSLWQWSLEENIKHIYMNVSSSILWSHLVFYEVSVQRRNSARQPHALL